MPAATPLHRAPGRCPVCADELITLRLGCPTCGTEVSGAFAPCPYCRLSEQDLAMLQVFLRSRGNLREVQTHLRVSYPTARQRFAELLHRLGLAPTEPALSESEVLNELAAGRLTVEQAADLLTGGAT